MTLLQSPFGLFTTALRRTTAAVKSVWTNGPVPCWTEYLRQNAGR